MNHVFANINFYDFATMGCIPTFEGRYITEVASVNPANRHLFDPGSGTADQFENKSEDVDGQIRERRYQATRAGGGQNLRENQALSRCEKRSLGAVTGR